MTRFDKFGEYMFNLLTAPLKRGTRAFNQFYIFFKVIGTLFDDCKRDIFRVRSESMVMTASEVMLPEHGRDRQMPRLKGESVTAYRTRLSMKGIIAEKAGTRDGILLALSALGYKESYIEPYYVADPERWAEFIVYLRGKDVSGVNDIEVIDAEIRKVKEASSLPSYGVDSGNAVGIRSQINSGLARYPLCGTIACGVYPTPVNVGHLLSKAITMQSTGDGFLRYYPLAGDTLASEQLYHILSERSE